MTTPRQSVGDGGARCLEHGPGATRTRDLLLRRQALYPAELRTRLREGKTGPFAPFSQPPRLQRRTPQGA